MINKNDLIIYCLYHNKDLINKFNLNNIPDYIKLFYTNDLEMPGDNINYLNNSLCELVAYYYIWKNNIYSPYVGFCHYRRWYRNLGLDNLEKYGVHYFGYCDVTINDIFDIEQSTGKLLDNQLFYKVKEYLYNSNKIDKKILDKYFNIKNNEIMHVPWCLMYILKWDYFCDICDLYFNFLEYVIGDYKNKNNYDGSRWWAWVSEILLGTFIALYFNNPKIENTSWAIPVNKVLYTESENEIDIKKWLDKHSRIYTTLYIKTSINIKEYYPIPNIIHDISEIPSYQEVIRLNIDEYINCLDPIDFMEGKYIIEKIK